MEPRTPFTDVVQGYVVLGSELLERWSEHAAKVASRLDTGRYDAESAAADLTACATLATETGFLLASEALDALAILTGRQYGPHMVDSDTFSSPIPGATLELAGPLLNGDRSDELPVRAVRVIPSPLDPDQTVFHLRADATGHHGGTYDGKVVASKSGIEAQQVTVWITVP